MIAVGGRDQHRARMPTPLAPIDLHTEYRTDPLGIDVRTPRFGWALTGGGRGARQSAWQVQVGSAPGAADLWDSGRVADDRQLAIAYAGRPLASRTRCHWRVRVWDEAGIASNWSAPAWFETAYINADEFPGEWIGIRAQGDDERHPLAAARWLRPTAAHGRAMEAWSLRWDQPADRPPRRALLHVLCSGHAAPWSSGIAHHLSVNGGLPDSGGPLPLSAPMTYDVTRWLRAGANHLAMRTVTVPDGAFIARLVVELADGGRIDLPTGGPGWRCRGVDRADPDPGWDAAGHAEWAAPDTLGPFGAGPWPAADPRNRADRLIPAMLLRRTVRVAKPLARARLHATACGVYELTIDGARVGDRHLAPGWTDYRVRVHYQTEDVTARLPPGEHELVATVGDGWWCGHLATPFGANWYGADKALRLALHLDYADGTGEVVATDGEWEGGTGPIRRADLMEGQVIDATRAPGAWRPVAIMPAPTGRLQAQPDEPARALMTLPARILTSPASGTWIVDFGQNLVGHVRLRVRGPRGAAIHLRHAEVLDLGGALWVDNLRSALAIDVFVCSGGDDVFAPSLTVHGFRYVEISGALAALGLDQVEAVVVGSDTPDRGGFSCDRPLLDRLHANIRWGQRGNFLSIPTDCPQRDERLGWTADTQVFARTAIHNADCAAFYAKYVDDLLDAQHPGGAFADYAPSDRPAETGRFGWADAGVIMPWTLWRCYGDLDVVARAWDGMRRYLAQRDRTAVDDLNADWSYGDWVSPPPQTPNAVLNPIHHAWMHRLMAEMADVLARADDAAHHRARFAAIAAAWRRANLAADGRVHTSDTQAAYACALRAGVIPADLVAAVGGHLVRAIERADWHLATGFLGTACLLPALSQAGRDDVAWRVLTAETAPGWLSTVRNGATTMWERWNTYAPETGPVNLGNMNSYNHYAFGAVGEWLYAAIAGIDRSDDDVGFRRLRLRPVPGGMCRHAGGTFRSPRGLIASAWRIEGEKFIWEVTVPPNCTAEVHVPCAGGVDGVREGEVAAREAPGLRHLRDDPGHAVFAAGAGSYRFTAPA